MPYKNQTDGKPLCVESALKYFHYIESTGQVFRRMADGSYKEIGTESHGHRVFTFNGKSYPTTHLIWLIKYGRLPMRIVEHRNRIGTDDRLDNLREATQSQNMANTEASKRSKSGVKGVVWDKTRSKWAVYIGKDYKCYNIGRFDTLDEAIEARIRAAQEMFGEFAR